MVVGRTFNIVTTGFRDTPGRIRKSFPRAGPPETRTAVLSARTAPCPPSQNAQNLTAAGDLFELSVDQSSHLDTLDLMSRPVNEPPMLTRKFPRLEPRRSR